MRFEVVSEQRERPGESGRSYSWGSASARERVQRNSRPETSHLERSARGFRGARKSKDLQNDAASFASPAIVEEESVSYADSLRRFLEPWF